MRINEKSFVVLVAGVLVVATVAALAWWTLLREEKDSSAAAARRSNPAASFAGGPPEVLIQSGTALVRRNLEEETEEVVGEIESPSVYAAPGSVWVASVSSQGGGPDDDFAQAPLIHLHDVETGEETVHGPGVAPVWNTAGTHLAYLRPLAPRNCLGETCPGDTRIGVLEAETGEETRLLEPGRYTILGWAGDRVVVSNFDDPTTVTTVSLDDDPAELGFPASQFWGASPDGRWVVRTNARKTEFLSLEDGELGEERIPVELGEQELLQGTWSHDSSMVAAVTRLGSAVPKGKGKFAEQEPTTQVVTFSPDAPEPELVDRTYGASGAVLWSPDNDAIVFTSLLDPRRALFQAKHCPLGNSEDCLIVTSWTEGVVLLRVE